MDRTDKHLLDAIQNGVPLCARPFAHLAAGLNTTENDVIARLRILHNENHVIRQISAVFDSNALGYESSLIAAHCTPEKLDTAAAVVGTHPGVTHCYQRNHYMNLWYTIAVPPDSRLKLKRTVDVLHNLSGTNVTLMLPVETMYKINVFLRQSDAEYRAAQFNSKHNTGNHVDNSRADRIGQQLTEIDKTVIRIAQQNLPLVPDAFADWADQIGCDVPELLNMLSSLKQRGYMRRFAAVLNHRVAGYTANVMVAWNIPNAHTDRCGELLAGYEAVSHCYRRWRCDDWPYNLYAMVHARSKNDAITLVSQMQHDINAIENIGDEQCALLWTVKEYKKTRLKYFTNEIPEWEAHHIGCNR